MRRWFRTAAWGLLALAVLAVAVIVSVGALRAHGTAEFNRWVGLATVAAVPLAAGALLLMLLDKILARAGWLTSGAHAEEVSGARESGGPVRSGDTLPFRNPKFTGRTEALEALGMRLAAGPVAVVAVRGLGGVGKSQLALEYAHRMRESGRYQLAGWVRAESAVTIAEDLAALAPLLGLTGEETVGEIAAQVVGALRSRRDWLVVFDNAQRPGDLAGMLPGGRGHVLITSRNRVWSGIATQVDLDGFSRAESVRFLCQRSGSEEPEAAGDLADALGNLPLALAQAAAYIDARALTIEHYLDLYSDPAIARRLREEGLESDEYPESVARTWLLHFDQLQGEQPAAVELLRLCAFLDSDDIDLALLSAGSAEAGDVLARVLGNPPERADATGALARTSLVTVSPEEHLRVHRLVQAVTRDQLDDDQAAEWAKRVLNLAEAILPPGRPDDYRSWPEYARLAPHIEAATELATSYPILADKISLLRNLGIYYSASRQLRPAHTAFERVLAISEAVHGPDHPEVAKALGNLAVVQRSEGKLRDARASIERALATLQEAYGPDDPEVALELDNLSVVQLELRDLTDARTNAERALPILQAAYGPGHPEVAKCFAILGAVQRERGELRDACTYFERAVASYEAAYGPSHLDVTLNLLNQSIIQLRLRKLRDARTSIERAVPGLLAAYEFLGRDSAKGMVNVMNLSYIRHHKIFGVFFFIFFLFAVFRTGWRTSR